MAATRPGKLAASCSAAARRSSPTLARPARGRSINASPEPFSNVIVSTGEDVTTAGLLGLAIAYPDGRRAIALILVGLSLWLVSSARRMLSASLNPNGRKRVERQT